MRRQQPWGLKMVHRVKFIEFVECWLGGTILRSANRSANAITKFPKKAMEKLEKAAPKSRQKSALQIRQLNKFSNSACMYLERSCWLGDTIQL